MSFSFTGEFVFLFIVYFIFVLYEAPAGPGVEEVTRYQNHSWGVLSERFPREFNNLYTRSLFATKHHQRITQFYIEIIEIKKYEEKIC